MVSKEFQVELENGMHARPAGLLVKSVGPLKCSVELRIDEKQINAKSIMAIMSGGLKYGTRVEVVCSGDEEVEAMTIIEALFNDNFNE